MKRYIVPISFAFVLGFAATPVARAGLISVTSGGIIIPAPLFIGDTDNPLPTHQQGFNEKQGVYVPGLLPVDGGAIAPGVTIDSHMIFFNQTGDGDLVSVATWTFSGEILGVMSDSPGSLEAFSSPFLGASGTSGYPAGGYKYRGMESDDFYTILTPTTLEVTMHIAQPGDWIRVITRSSVPDSGATASLLAFGLIAIAWIRKIRSR